MSSVVTIKTPFIPGKKPLNLFRVSPLQMLTRLLHSIFPPNLNFHHFEIDFVMPGLIFVFLCGLLEYVAPKIPKIHPTIVLSLYMSVIPILTYLILKLGRTSLHYFEILGIFGYALFSHVLVILTAIYWHRPQSAFTFFIVFIILGGLSCFRIIVIFTFNTKIPALTLLAGCFACIFHLLLILFTYFSYIHVGYRRMV